MSLRHVDVSTEIQDGRFGAVVAAYAADPENAARVVREHPIGRVANEPPLQVGSVIGFAARFLGRLLEYEYEIVVLEPGMRLVMRTAQGPFPMETSPTRGRRRPRALA